MSAFGLALADVVHEAQQPSSASYKPGWFRHSTFITTHPYICVCNKQFCFVVLPLAVLCAESFNEFDDLIDRLTAECVDELQSQGFSRLVVDANGSQL